MIFVVAAITDKIDGALARKRREVTDLGKFLDPLADKMLVDTGLVALTVMGVVPIWVLMIILWRDLAVDGARMMAASRGKVVAASNWGKWKTTVQMVALLVLLLNLFIPTDFLGVVGMILLYLAVILTVVSGVECLGRAGVFRNKG